MGKQLRYGILLEVFGKNTGIIRDVERGLARVGKAAKSLAFGTGGIGGALGRLGLGGLVGGGLFAPLIGAAKLAVGGVLSVFKLGFGAVVGVVRAGISVAGGIIRTGLRALKSVAIVGLGIGAAVAWQIGKGIRENMQLADIRQVLRKLLGAAAKDAEEYARKLSLRTPFTPMQELLGAAGLAAVGLDVKRYLEPISDWAAGAKVPLGQVVELMQRAGSGQFGEAMEGARRALIMHRRDLQPRRRDLQRRRRLHGQAEQFVQQLMSAAMQRFGGMAAQAAEVGSGRGRRSSAPCKTCAYNFQSRGMTDSTAP